MAKIVFNTDIIIKDGTIGYTEPQSPNPPPQSLKREKSKSEDSEEEQPE